jgi:Tir chaperone protein (CesT) family
MVNSQFGAILKEFEAFLKCPLEPDLNDSCLIKMKKMGISIQLEMDRYGKLLIGCRVGALPMSRFRENMIKQALKSNEATLPSTGIFGFSHKSSQLILFLHLNPDTLTNDQILAVMPPFIAKAKLWADAIAKGEIPSIDLSTSKSSPSGLFGLMTKSDSK